MTMGGHNMDDITIKDLEQAIEKLESIAELETDEEIVKEAEKIADEALRKASYRKQYFKRIV